MRKAPQRVAWAVEQLAVGARDDVLELGCGAGHAVALLCARCSRGTVTALDRSALQVEKARALNREAVAAGRVRLETLTLAEAPSALGRRFSKVLAINVNAFWTEPAQSLESARKLLRARGTLLLAYEAPSSSGLAKLAASVPRALESNGFAVEAVRRAGAGSTPLFAFIARPSS